MTPEGWPLLVPAELAFHVVSSDTRVDETIFQPDSVKAWLSQPPPMSLQKEGRGTFHCCWGAHSGSSPGLHWYYNQSMRNENSSFFLGLFWHKACRSDGQGTSTQSFMGRSLSRLPTHSAFDGVDGYLTTDFFFFLWYLAWVEWLLSKDFCLVRLLLSGPLAIKSRLLLEIFSSVLYEILICFLLQHQLWDIWGKKQPREHDVVIWSFNSQLICFLLTY